MLRTAYLFAPKHDKHGTTGRLCCLLGVGFGDCDSALAAASQMFYSSRFIYKIEVYRYLTVIKGEY